MNYGDDQTLFLYSSYVYFLLKYLRNNYHLLKYNFCLVPSTFRIVFVFHIMLGIQYQRFINVRKHIVIIINKICFDTWGFSSNILLYTLCLKLWYFGEDILWPFNAIHIKPQDTASRWYLSSCAKKWDIVVPRFIQFSIWDC